MRARRWMGVVLVLGAQVALGGCAQYAVAGRFEGAVQPFYGRVVASLMDSGTLKVSSADGTLTCRGTTRVTQRPSMTSNIGTQGSASAACSDGRTFKVDFVQTSETGGRGQGIDDRGNIVTLFYDSSKSAAHARLDQDRLDALVQ